MWRPERESLTSKLHEAPFVCSQRCPRGAPNDDPMAIDVPLVPSELRYSCVSCGRCCTDFDDVEIDAATAERVRRLPLFNPRLDLPPDDGALPFREAPATASGLVLRRVERAAGGERCVFLDDDRLCALHGAHGAAAKPTTCRSFPFRFVDTPSGVTTSVSFACTAVLYDVGEPLTDQAEALGELVAITPDVRDVWEPVVVTPDRSIDWPAYLALESELTAMLDEHGDPGDALRRQAVRLRAEAGLQTHDSVAGDPDLRSRAVGRALDPLRDADGRVPLRHPDLEDTVAALDLPPPQAPDRLLRRYYRHRLFRKDLLRAHSVLFNHNLMLVEHALIAAYADAIAVRRNRDRPTSADFTESVRLVEQQFVAHSRFVEIAASDDHAEAWQELFDEPGFVAAMTRAD